MALHSKEGGNGLLVQLCANDTQPPGHRRAPGAHVYLARYIVKVNPGPVFRRHNALRPEDCPQLSVFQLLQHLLNAGLGKLFRRLHAPAGKDLVGVVVMVLMVVTAPLMIMMVLMPMTAPLVVMMVFMPMTAALMIMMVLISMTALSVVMVVLISMTALSVVMVVFLSMAAALMIMMMRMLLAAPFVVMMVLLSVAAFFVVMMVFCPWQHPSWSW